MSASPLQEEGNGEAEENQAQEDIESKEGHPEDPERTTMDDDLYRLEVKEQDRWLPIANVARIMKTALPDNAKIAKEAKECMQECVSEFISFITSEASEKCQQEKRKTVNGEDILFAMTSLGFENYGEALKIYLARFRETHVSKSEPAAKPTNGQRGAVPIGGGGDVLFDQPTTLVGENNPVNLGANATVGGSDPKSGQSPNATMPASMPQDLGGQPGTSQTGGVPLPGEQLGDEITGAGLTEGVAIEGGSYSYDV